MNVKAVRIGIVLVNVAVLTGLPVRQYLSSVLQQCKADVPIPLAAITNLPISQDRPLAVGLNRRYRSYRSR